MRKMRIAVDQDEVLCHWTSRVVQWYNEDKKTEFDHFGQPYDRQGMPFVPVTLDNMTNWDVKMNLGPESEPYVRSYMRSILFWQGLDPIEGAVEGMRTLIEQGHDVLIVTAVPKCAPVAYEGKMAWIRRHLPFFDLENFITMKRKDLVDADILIDDGEHNLDAFSSKDPDHHWAIAFDRPWNRKAGTCYRANDWNEVIERVGYIQKMICS